MSLKNFLSRAENNFVNASDDFDKQLESAKTIVADFRANYAIDRILLSKLIFTVFEGKLTKKGKPFSLNGKLLVFANGINGLGDLFLDLSHHLDDPKQRKIVVDTIDDAIRLLVDEPGDYITAQSSTWLPTIVRRMVSQYLAEQGLGPDTDFLDLVNLLE